MTINYNTWRRELCLASAWCCVIKISAKNKTARQTMKHESSSHFDESVLSYDRHFFCIAERTLDTLMPNWSTRSFLFYFVSFCLVFPRILMTCVLKILINIIRHVTLAHIYRPPRGLFFWTLWSYARHFASMNQYLKQHPDPRKSRNCRCSLLLLPRTAINVH